MGTFAKIRNLGQYGILADRDPYDLPPEAWSGGSNIRFRNGRVSRSPIWKPVTRLTKDTTGPQWVLSDTFSSGADDIFICYADGRVTLATPTGETDYSPTGYTADTQDIPWTNCHLANVCYVNRGLNTGASSGAGTPGFPWYIGDPNAGGTGKFQTVPYWGLIKTAVWTANTASSTTVTLVANPVAGYYPVSVGQHIYGPGIPAGATITAVSGTTVTISAAATATASGVILTSGTLQTWEAGLIRTVGGALVGLNMTINGTPNPTMVVTSSFAESNSPPGSWDYAVVNTDATQNVLSEIEGGIIDACSLGNNLVVYGYNSSWLMAPSLGTEIFDYIKLPYTRGSINANCSVEIDGKNYVFGPDDIWVHDGTSEKSLINDRNRDYVFSNLDFGNTKRCFVGYNPALREIYFCYPTKDASAYFSGGGSTGVLGGVVGANRCAVYNWMDDNWSFDDLPSVYGSAYANTTQSAEWQTLDPSGSTEPPPTPPGYNPSGTTTWTNVGGSWNSQDQNEQRTVIFAGDGSSTSHPNNYGLVDTLYAYDLWGLGSTSAFYVDTNATAPAHLERDGIDLDQIQGINLPDYKLFSSLFPLARLDASANTTLDIKFGTSDYYGQQAIFDGIDQTYDGGALYKLDYNMAGRFAAMKITWADYTTFSISGFDFLVDETGQR